MARLPPLTIAAATVLVVLWFLRVRRGRQALRDGVRTWAQARGWAFAPNRPDLLARWAGYPFGFGGTREATDLATGAFNGRAGMSFNYRYTSGAGRKQNIHVVALGLPLATPGLRLTGHGLVWNMGEVFAGPDINIGDPMFDQAWKVVSPVPAFAHDVLATPAVRSVLMRVDARGTNLALIGTDLVTWSPSDQTPEHFETRLRLLADLLAAVPDGVWQRCGAPPVPTI